MIVAYFFGATLYIFNENERFVVDKNENELSSSNGARTNEI